MYADDATLTSTLCCKGLGEIPDLDISNPSLSINSELGKIYDWLCINKLSLNISKTKFMVFHLPQMKLRTSNIPILQINNNHLERVSVFNFLGTTISETLSWKPHVNNVCKRLSRTIGILNKLKNTVPSHTLLNIYNSLFNSYMNQSILVWGHSPGRIPFLQKKAIRLVCKSKYLSHTEGLLKQQNLLKFQDIYNCAMLKFYYKYCNNKLPPYFDHLLDNETVQHNYDTRQNFTRHQMANKVYTSKCIRFFIPRLIENLPQRITEKCHTHSLGGFSSYIKNFYCSTYSENCVDPNCYSCNAVS